MIENISVTGDVHQFSFKSREHAGITREQYFDIIRKYLRILEENGLRCTLYVTGKALSDDSVFWHDVQKRGHVIGLHTWDAWENRKIGVGYANMLFTGCAYGVKAKQFKDISKCDAVKEEFGVVDWRTHSYQSNKFTREILVSKGYKTISDNFILSTDKFAFLPRYPGVFNILPDVPIIAPEDHSCVTHYVLGDTRKGLWSPQQYIDYVKKLKEEGIVGCLQLHPLCQYWIDDFEMFKKICQLLGR